MHDIHGGNIYALIRQLAGTRDAGNTTKQGLSHGAMPLDLSTNTFLACADLAGELIASVAASYLHYPDPESHELCEAIAAHELLTPDCVLPGNGAAELIWLSLAALRPRSVFMLGPMFSEYVRACTQMGIAYELCTPQDGQGFAPGPVELEALRCSAAEMVIVCQPNNPAGLAYEQMEALCTASGTRTMLIDLSYREFLYASPPAAQSVWRQLQAWCKGRVIGLHSMTKFFCCPGIRLGYALADEGLVRTLRGYQPPWMVSEHTGKVGMAMLARIDDFRAHLPMLREQRADMVQQLIEVGIFEAERVFAGPSFVTARLRALRAPVSAGALCSALAARGILIRNCDTIPGMPQGYVRMQVRAPRELVHLYAALHAFRAISL